MLANLVDAAEVGAVRAVAVDGTVLSPDTTVGEAGVRDGCIITLLDTQAPPPFAEDLPDAVVRLRIVSGRGAGTVHHVGAGTVLIGRAERCTIVVADPLAGEVDLGLVIDAEGQITVALGTEKSAAMIAGEPAVDGARLLAGSQLAYADCVIEMGDLETVRAAIVDSPEDGRRKYNRPPRILPPDLAPRFVLPTEPREPEKQPLPILMAMLPLMASIAMAYLLRNPMMLMFGLMSPLMLMGSWLTGRKTGRRRFKRETAEYKQRDAQVREDARAALAAERVQARRAHPDPTQIAAIATVPTPRLWERRLTDEAWLVLRVGTVTQPATVSLDDPQALEHKREVRWDLHNAPLTVRLALDGVMGIAGDGDATQARALTAWLCAQIATLHSPREVQLYLLSGAAKAAEQWEAMSWYPHTVPGLGQDTVRTVSASAPTVAARLGELISLLTARSDAMKENGQRVYAGTNIVVVVDGASRLRSMPGLVRLLKEGPAVGIYSLCVEADERLLPEECVTVAVVQENGAVLHRQRQEGHTNFMADLPDANFERWVARAIAPIEDTTPTASDGAIPSSSRLLEVLELDPPSAQQIGSRWSLNPRSTVAVIGESLDGAFALDLVKDGPHGLIGGTTGSGKSEFLQTIVASLAVANSPQEMNFVLVDYKGGAAFKDCEFLPHTVGMVTDLDLHQVERALESLGAELRFREHVLAEAGAKDLEDYQDLAARKGLSPVPRLLVVVDEFASMVRDLPDFVTGLVNLAQRGRSLGIHLLLATQRPSGAVSPEIRANTNLRIALRMTDGAESSDVIDSPEAGNIAKATPGRAYARLGANSLIPFQAGRVGGRAPVADDGEVVIPDPVVRPLSFAELAAPVPRPPKRAAAVGDVEVTDLRLLVKAIQEANTSLDIPAQRKPWLPALPDVLPLDELAMRAGSQPAQGTLWFGLEDHPDEQRQEPVGFTPGVDSHLYLVGASRSGKTTALRSIAAAAGEAFSTQDLHLYVIDCGNGGLLPLSAFPHAGAVVLRHQGDQMSRMLNKLRALAKQRQRDLAAAGVSSLAELRAVSPPEQRPAHVMLMLDGWDTFASTFESVDGGALLETVYFLLREGAAVGIHVVISGDRQLITSGRLSTLAERKIVLRLIERSDYTFIGVRARSLPETIGDGRAFASDGGTEMQLAITNPDLTPQEQTAALRGLGEGFARRDAALPKAARPFVVAVMPEVFTLEEARADHAELSGGSGEVFLGLGGEDVEPLTIDLLQQPTFTVAGPARSGRSTALLGIVESALEKGWPVLVLAPRKSPLRSLDGAPGVVGVITEARVTKEHIEEAMDGRERLLIAVDDAELLKDAPMDDYLREVIPQAGDRGLAVAIAGDTESLGKGFSGWIVDTRKSRRGVLLSPREMFDAEVIGVKLSRSDLAAEIPPGRGYTVDQSGSTVQVQMPLVRGRQG